MPLFYTLIIAHLAADFLQPSALVKWTKQSMAGLLVHTGIYAALSAVVLTGYGRVWWLWLAILVLSHFVLDHFKYILSHQFVLWGLYLFVADQILHIGVIALIVFAGNVAALEPSPFLVLISSYWYILPIIAGYVAGTFGVSILVFEAGGTFAHQSSSTNITKNNNSVLTFRDRLTGILERTLAISVILAHLYYLAPLCFGISIYRFGKRRKTVAGRRLAIELGVSIISAVAVGVAISLVS